LVLSSLFLLALPAGCGGGSGGATGTAATGGGAGTGGANDPNQILGALSVKMLDQTPPASQVSGVIRARERHELTLLDEMARDGSCRLLKPRQPFCTQPCTLPNACIADDVCVDNDPPLQNLGTVTFKGLKLTSGAASLQLENASNAYGTGEPLNFPPFDEGADVSVEATGADLAAFTIHAKGIAPLVLGAESYMLERGKPIVLTWTAKGAGADSTIHVKLDISHHGGTKAQIECDAPDNGSLTLAASLITPLFNLGFSGFPTIDVTRASVGTASLAQGKVQLTLNQYIQRPVTIPGLVSCTMDEDCPTGQTCQTDLQCK
jgi:hypothetical protein